MTTFVLLALLIPASLRGDQGAAPVTARVAAVRYAIEHGLEIPRSNIVVAEDTLYAMPHPPSSRMTAELASSEARDIAKVLGQGVRTGRASEFLQCPKWRCELTTGTSLLLVNEPDEENTILIRAYSPPERPDALVMLAQVIVHLQEREHGWVAVAHSMGPTRGAIKR